MISSSPISTPAGRDPVCEAIESLLADLEARGDGALVTTVGNGVVRLGFGRLHVEADTYDVALVRLASAMMDDRRYSPVLIRALRGPMHSSAQIEQELTQSRN